MNNIIFIGGIFSEKIMPVILKNSNGVIQNAADVLQKATIKGIKEYNANIEIVNLPFIGSYPSLYRQLFINFDDDIFEGINVKNISFINLKGYKIFSRFINTLKSIFNRKNSTLIIYSINISFLLAVYINKIFNKSNRIILIVPDLPEFMNSKMSFFKDCLLKVQNVINQKLIYPKIDCFVLLTEQMGVRLNLDKSKIKVIEGIYSDQIIKQRRIRENKFKILYTGTLDLRYGVLDLVNQFSIIVDDEIELLICGAGDGESEIVKKIEKDNRIKFLGQLPRTEILELQRGCSLLVNPRKPEEYTKYSFPSKTMEYFASGTPVLMFKLDGVPSEYFEYCFTLNELDTETISKEIIRIKNISFMERQQFGLKAQNFISNNKNPKEQIKKLKHLIDANDKK